MTTLAAPTDLPLPSPRRSKLAWAAADSVAIAQRNLIGMTRRPQLLAFVTIQPVLFVLMFRYVFGGSIRVSGASYTNYLMAGIFVTTVLFGAQNTAIGMAEDLRGGLIERFRSLVMARSAVLADRILADTLRNLFVIALCSASATSSASASAPTPQPWPLPPECCCCSVSPSPGSPRCSGWRPRAPRRPAPPRSRSPSCSPFPPAPSC